MAGDQWFYSKAGSDEKHGPVTTVQLKELAAKGELARTDLIWREGMAEWTPAGQAKGLFPSPAEPPPLPSEQAGPPPLPDNAADSPPARARGRRSRTARPEKPAGFWATFTDPDRPWSTGWMAGLSVAGFLLSPVGIVAGIVGLQRRPKRVQGGVLLTVAVLSILIGYGVRAGLQEGGQFSGAPAQGGASQPQGARTGYDAEYEVRMQALEKFRRDMAQQREEARMWEELTREPLF